MIERYRVLPEGLVPAPVRIVCNGVAKDLARLLDVTQPSIEWIERAGAGAGAGPGAGPGAGDDRFVELELDINVSAAIAPDEPDVLWVVYLEGELQQTVRFVAHEIAHIAGLLGRAPDGDDPEALPLRLANAVESTYAAGVDWVRRLLDSDVYFLALSDGRLAQAMEGGWQREEYWERLERTHASYRSRRNFSVVVLASVVATFVEVAL